MQKTNFLRILLILQLLTVGTFTVLAIINEGPNFMAVFLSNLQTFGWNSQFGLDFSSYLVLSGVWIAWRNRFSQQSILLALVAAVLGIIVFAPYFLWLLMVEKGDIKRVLIGNR